VRYDEANWLQRRLRALPGLGWVIWFFSRWLRPLDRLVFRISGGRSTLVSLLTGLPVVMLTTTGARSGQLRTLPVLGIPDGGRTVVLASNWGKQHHPSWYHNLRADPHASVTVRGRTTPVRASDATGEERDRLWSRALGYYPTWRIYQSRAGDRRIPIVVLTPADPDPTPTGPLV
jgi:deazaflavin-dependent oxidoreductase (nitroreductase family)